MFHKVKCNKISIYDAKGEEIISYLFNKNKIKRKASFNRISPESELKSKIKHIEFKHNINLSLDEYMILFSNIQD